MGSAELRKHSIILVFVYNLHGTAFLSSIDFLYSDPAAIFLSRSMCSAIIVFNKDALEPCTTATGSPRTNQSIKQRIINSIWSS